MRYIKYAMLTALVASAASANVAITVGSIYQPVALNSFGNFGINLANGFALTGASVAHIGYDIGYGVTRPTLVQLNPVEDGWPRSPITGGYLNFSLDGTVTGTLRGAYDEFGFSSPCSLLGTTGTSCAQDIFGRGSWIGDTFTFSPIPAPTHNPEPSTWILFVLAAILISSKTLFTKSRKMYRQLRG